MQDEQGQPRTLLTGAAAYVCLREGLREAAGQSVVLGLVCAEKGSAGQASQIGDEELFPGAHIVPMVNGAECADVTNIAMSIEDALGQGGSVWLHTQALKLFPSFFGPLVAKVQVGQKKPAAIRQQDNGLDVKKFGTWVCLPGQNGLLLHEELKETLQTMGFKVQESQKLPVSSLVQNPPNFVLSVNARGFLGDAETDEGAIFYACKELGIPVALWLVDNPWLILSGLRAPWWKKTHIFITDPSFVPQLKAHGAEHVYVLPLGVSKVFAQEGEQGQGQSRGSFVFVGSSAFAKKNQYFAAAKVQETVLAEAMQVLEKAGQPHFNWWAEKSGETCFWPGYGVRAVAAGAEACSQAHRVAWLKAALPLGLNVYGDAGWECLLGIQPKPPIPYGQELAQLYHAAGFTLDIGSLLLPQGLSQRHFDVWAAGGFLLSTAQQALNLFPEELTKPITLVQYKDLPERAAYFAANPAYKKKLQKAWQAELLGAHTYRHRLANMLKKLGVQV